VETVGVETAGVSTVRVATLGVATVGVATVSTVAIRRHPSLTFDKLRKNCSVISQQEWPFS
jgi:hypothetical protein